MLDLSLIHIYSDYYIGIAKDEFQKLHIHRKIEHSKRVYKLAVEIAQKLGCTASEAEIVVTAIVGMIGIVPTIAAMKAGKDIEEKIWKHFCICRKKM